MEITRNEVEHVAKLARLELSEDEKDTFARQLSAILTYMDELKTADTTGIEPTATVLPADNVFRDDEIRPSLAQDKALANAPDQADGFFRVPRIIEDR
jgi:aspartyl-tRNA(Asn)/glutamyl-tRNA(Gln) amidotransferase subunit C